MRKILFTVIAIVIISVSLILMCPPGDDAFNSYVGYTFNSKGRFISKKEFEVSMKVKQEGTNSPYSAIDSSNNSNQSNNLIASGDYIDIVLPDDMSQDNLRIWLQHLSIAPERRAILQFLIDIMGTMPYVYGGQGRARYKLEPSEWGNGTDCSGMVTAAYYRGGIDFGQCYATSGMIQVFANQSIPREEAMPGDFSVVNGHTEVYLGHSSDGGFVFIGIRTKNDPPGPSVIKNHGKLISNSAIWVRPTQLREFDNNYYLSQQ